MATKAVDIGYSSLGQQSTLTLSGGGVAVSRDCRLAWDDTADVSDILGLILTIEDAFKSRLRAEGLCAANG